MVVDSQSILSVIAGVPVVRSGHAVLITRESQKFKKQLHFHHRPPIKPQGQTNLHPGVNLEKKLKTAVAL